MRKDKDEVIALRRSGKTYNEIRNKFDVSKSTLAAWFKDIPWSEEIKTRNTDQHIVRSKIHLERLNKGRDKRLKDLYRKAVQEAHNEFKTYKNQGLFHAGLMLYVGEGGKTNPTCIRLANVDFNVHRTFILFCEKYLKIPRESIKFSLLLYPDLDIDVCKRKWCSELSITENQIYKPQVIQGREKVKRLHFGVGTTIILNTYAKKKLFAWIDEAFKTY